MSCCDAATAFFDDTVARRDLRNYRRRGPGAQSRKLLQALGSVLGHSVIDVGSGIGAMTHGAIAAGAEHVTAVDASKAYLNALSVEAERQGHAERIRMQFGDFVAVADSLDSADMVTMDRVICCYSDVSALLTRAASKARGAVGLTYPRATQLSRLGIRVFNWIQHLRGCDFRVYYHTSAQICDALYSSGFELAAQDRTLLWQVAVFRRP